VHRLRSAAAPVKQSVCDRRANANESEFKNCLIKNVYSPDCRNYVVKEDIKPVNKVYKFDVKIEKGGT
jgi:hypothetical protein